LAQSGRAGAVLHTHSVPATVLSEGFLTEGHLVIRGYEMLKGLAGIGTHETAIEVEIFHNTQDIPALAAVIADQLNHDETPLRHGFLIAGHGLYTWGADIAAARRHVEVFEFLFEVMVQKRLLFGHW
jgi:methylthioribulose-1-phosphate dehydratase